MPENKIVLENHEYMHNDNEKRPSSPYLCTRGWGDPQFSLLFDAT